MSDVVVVGGGVVGLSAAYHLVCEGARVTLVDRSDAGQATAAGAGILSGGALSRGTDPLHELAVKAFDYYPALIARLEADDAGDTGYARCPLMLIASDERDRREFEAARAAIFARQAATGRPAPEDLREIAPDEARRLFPPLGDARCAAPASAAVSASGRAASPGSSSSTGAPPVSPSTGRSFGPRAS